MGNSLLNYLNKRIHEVDSKDKGDLATAGPVVTISREVGCGGLVLSNMLSEELNRVQNNSKWKIFSKEVFYKSARELNIESEKVKKVIKQSNNSSFEQMLNAFGNKNYKSNQKIVKTVRDVVYDIAVEGFCIILGRGGHIIAKDIGKSLHIRLIAPLEYRIRTIMNNNNLNRKEAEIFINKVEKERIVFRKNIKAEGVEETDFDFVINCASFTSKQSAEAIVQIMKSKGVI